MERYCDLCNGSDFFDEEEFTKWCEEFDKTVGDPEYIVDGDFPFDI